MPLIHRARFLPATTGGIGEGSGSSSARAVAPLGDSRRCANVASNYVAPRNVDVCLPPRYAMDAGCRFPVIWTNDGHNLFDPRTACIGADWGIEEVI